MRRLSDQPPPWVRSYIGIEFAERGRDRDGADCWGGVRLIYAERFGIMLPSYVDVDDNDQVGVVAAMEIGSGRWVPIDAPELVGDVGLFRAVGGRRHVGMAVDRARMFHVERGVAAAVEPWGGSVWGDRCLGWYRFGGPVDVRLRDNPFEASTARVLTVEPGATITEIVRQAGVVPASCVSVEVGGSRVSQDRWDAVRPKHGRLVTIAVVPEGGGDGSKVLRTVAVIAVVAAALVAPYALGITANATYLVGGVGGIAVPGSLAAAGVSAAVTIGGLLAVNALIPPPGPRLQEFGDAETTSPVIRGARNEFRRYGVVPVILGEHRFAPPYGARPYTEVVGDDQFLRMIFLVGYGPLEIDELKIGDTAIDEFEGVEYEIRTGDENDEPFQIYPGTIIEQSLTDTLTFAGGFVTRTGALDADELSIDVTFLQGLFQLDDSGNRQSATVQVQVEFSKTGLGVWEQPNENSPLHKRALGYLVRDPESPLDDGQVAFSGGTYTFLTKRHVIAGGGFARATAGASITYQSGTGIPGGGTTDTIAAKISDDEIELSTGLGIGSDGATDLAGFFVIQPTGTYTDQIAWSEGTEFPDDPPDYIDASGGWAWRVRGWVYAATSGTYTFAVDSSDAADVLVNHKVVASWYGSHAPAGSGGVPDFTGHNGTIELEAGWHRFAVRVETRDGTTTGAIAIGWKEPGDGAFSIIPSSKFAQKAAGTPAGLTYDLHDHSDYDGLIDVTDSSTTALRRALAWAVPEPGQQYDVRVKRNTADSTSDRVFDVVTWTALRTIRDDDPIQMPGVAAVALRIKATNQLNGVVDQFNVVARSIIKDWDGANWIRRTTTNPASCYRHVLQGAPNKRPIANAGINLTALQSWHDANVAEGYECRMVLDFDGTVWQRLADVAATGRASPGIVDGLYTVVRDIAQSTPVQHFTPRNSTGFRGRIAFPTRTHALRVRFLNQDQQYLQDERIIPDDGYAVNGLDAFGDPTNNPEAELFETIDLFGVTEAEQVWKHARYFLAVARLRPEIFEIGVDAEHLLVNRGDLVLVTHDVPRFGQDSGRIISVKLALDGDLDEITLDNSVVMDPGIDYVLRVRLEDGTSRLLAVVNEPGETDVVTIQDGNAQSSPPVTGDNLWMFGPTDLETRECVVKSIEMGSDLEAQLTLVDHAPAVHDADTGTIPPFDSGITDDPDFIDAPADPVIEQIRSDESVIVIGPGGELIIRMVITLAKPSGTKPIPNAAQVRIRPTGTNGPWKWIGPIPIENNDVSVFDVEQGVTYDIRIRVITPEGIASGWVSATHTVVGWTLAPPDVDAFSIERLNSGLRRYTWTLGDHPPDVVGVDIRYKAFDGTTPAFSSMTPLSAEPIQGSPQDFNEPPKGSWTFAIVMQDSSGNVSANPLYVNKSLGPPLQDDVAFVLDGRASEWPGTKTNCFVDNNTYLAPTDGSTWATLSSTYGISQWSDWSSWYQAVNEPIVYEHPAFDAGFSFWANPDADVIATGDVTVEVRYADTEANLALASYAEISTLSGKEVEARWWQWRITAAANASVTIPVIQDFIMYLRAETVEEVFDDLVIWTLDEPYFIGTGDFRVPITAGAYAKITTVSLGFNGTGAGWTWEVVEKDPILGPRIRLYNADGELANAIVDVIVRGIGSQIIPDPVGAAGGSPSGRIVGELDYSESENSGHVVTTHL